MKVLFAVGKDSLSNSIIDKYRRKYKEILTYKNVYYFNAVVKELQNNKDYDRIIISEELEEFANNNNYDTIDKFIFEKLDNISDEANDTRGKEISIIFICTERRQKGDELLSKLFSIGVYNALIGDDRTYDLVCELIKNPRTKKEAKSYYKIDSESSSYRAENENEVSEVEIQNILTHFRKIGKSTENIVKSFDNIAAQYTEEQLRIIANCLPAKIKSVLSENSDKYQKLAATGFGLGVVGEKKENTSKKSGIKVNMLEKTSQKEKITKPIVIPSNVKKVNSRKTTNSEENVEKSSGIKIQKKPTSLQEKIERRATEETERLKALKKQKEIERMEKGEELEEKAPVKKKETVKNSKPKQEEPEKEEEDIFANDIFNDEIVKKEDKFDDDIFDDVPEDRTKKLKAKTENQDSKLESKQALKEDYDDDFEFDDDILGNIETEEDEVSIPEPKFDLDDLDDDLFADDEEEVEETKPEEKAEDDFEFEDDLFADDEEEIQEAKPEEKDEDDFEFEDDLFADDEEEVEEAKPEEKDEDDFEFEDDLFADDEEEIQEAKPEEKDEDDFEFEDDLFADDEEAQETKPAEKSKDIDEDFEFDDLEDLPGMDSFDVDDEVTENVQKEENNFEDFDDFDFEDVDDFDFGDDTDLPGMDDLDSPEISEIDDLEDFEHDEEKSKSAESNQGVSDAEEEFDIENFEDFDEDLFEDSNTVSEIVNKKVEKVPEKKVEKVERVNSSKTLAKDVSAIESIKPKVNYSISDFNKYLSKDKKVVNFVGTTKNGVSFLVNNLAHLFSSIGVNTAVLDMTKNRNSYYIYTNNDPELRKIADSSFEKLENGYAEGIRVNKNLTIYTNLPTDTNNYNNAEAMLSTLIQSHSIVLVDCDYDTDPAFFALCQEIYLVQTMDILTMQPLTTFLRDLQVKNILEPEKLRVVINKEIKVRDLTPKVIIGGMSYYKDPGMSVMVELFNKDLIKACSIPFEDNTYSKYLEAMANCEISLSGYSKAFMAKLKNLGEMIYSLDSKPSYSSGPITQDYNYKNKFSNNMNDTLKQMKKKF